MAWKHAFHPTFAPTSYWDDGARETPRTGALPEQSEIAIVGTGVVALTCALTLARAKRSVWIIEPKRHIATSGASPLGHTGLDGGALAPLEALIQRERIACDYQRSGAFIAALTRAQMATLAHTALDGPASRSMVPRQMQSIPRADQWRYSACARYRGGLLVADAGALHLGKLLAQLRQRCLDAGVGFAASDIDRLDTHPGRHTLTTRAGTLQAAQVVLPSSAAVARLLPVIGRHLVPCSRYLIATEPLTAEMINALFPDRRTVLESGYLRHALRISPDDTRVLFSGPMASRRVPIREATVQLYSRLLERLPHLRGARITHGWSAHGLIPSDGLGRIGVERGVHYWVDGDDGGIATDALVGARIARRILANSGADGATDPSGAEVGHGEEPPPLTSTWLDRLTRHGGFEIVAGFHRQWNDRRERRRDA